MMTDSDLLELGPVASEHVERSQNAAGQQVYRHIIVTDWMVEPLP